MHTAHVIARLVTSPGGLSVLVCVRRDGSACPLLGMRASLPPDGAYGKPSPRRHLKSQQIQGLTISDLCIPKSFDRCMAMRYAGLIEARAEDL